MILNNFFEMNFMAIPMWAQELKENTWLAL